jgi:hypothetical protein
MTYRAADVRAVERALERMQPGDHLELAGGRYPMKLVPQRSGTAERWLTIRAAQGQTVVIDAAGRGTALKHDGHRYIRIVGLTFRGAVNRQQAEQAMVRPGSHWELRNCVIEHARSAGLGLVDVQDVLIADCTIQHNGQIGAGVSGSERVTIRGGVLRHNNPGFATEQPLIEVGLAERVEVEGRWFVNPAWEAGGIKISSSRHVLLEGVEAHDNHGPGLWPDYDNQHVTLRNCHAHHHRSVDEPWQGMGIMVEYHAEGPVLVEGCRVNDNAGVGLGIAESRNVTVRGNRIVRDELEFRAMDRPGASLESVEVTGNEFHIAQVRTSLGHWDAQSAADRKLTLDHNRWSPYTVYTWGNLTVHGLRLVQHRLGVELNSVEVQSDRP